MLPCTTTRLFLGAYIDSVEPIAGWLETRQLLLAGWKQGNAGALASAEIVRLTWHQLAA